MAKKWPEMVVQHIFVREIRFETEFICKTKGFTNFFSPKIVDDKLETLAFGVCNTDGDEGLSWAEVEQCQVSM